MIELLIDEDYKAIKQELIRCDGWIKRRVLIARLRFSGHKISDRRLRKLSELTGDIITGQRGYIWHELATQDEIMHCVADLRSRSSKMHHHANRLSRHIEPILGDLFLEKIA